MNAEREEIRVVGEGTLRGTIDPAELATADRKHVVPIRLADGRVVSVPFRTLQKQADNSYYVPLSPEALEGLDLTSEERMVLVVPIVEEEVELLKRPVTTGRVRLTRRVIAREEDIDTPTTREIVKVERVPINRVLDEPAQVRFEGETMVIPVMEEQVVVERRWVLKEEVRVTKEHATVERTEHVRLRQQDVTVTRLGPGEEGPPGSEPAVASGS